jgi:hypothetical protein
LRRQTDEYDRLQQAATEYQNVISDTHHTATEQDYRNLIQNGEAQIDNLNAQIAAWKEYQSTTEEGSKDWASAQGNIDSLSNAIASMTQNINGWGDAIRGLPLAELQRNLEMEEATQNRIQAELANKDAFGDVVSADYDESVKTAQD